MTNGALLRARITAFAATVPLLMRLRIDRVDRLVTPRRRAAASPGELATLNAALDGVLTHPRRPVRTGCLTRGVTRYRFLRRAGANVSLCFGMGTIDTGLEAHCWIELDGEPAFETRDVRKLFAETYRFPCSTSTA